MTNSEKLLSSFSEDFFYKELVYADLKFVPEGGTEIELADLIINLEDVIPPSLTVGKNKNGRKASNIKLCSRFLFCNDMCYIFLYGR